LKDVIIYVYFGIFALFTDSALCASEDLELD